MNASYIKAALRLKYAAPQYAILEEVRNATGRVKRRRAKGAEAGPRYADMIAMALWPSLGLEIIGFEVKTTRADWLKEISDEKKAVAVQQFCDRWTLVVPHKNHEKTVRPGELPETWGMLTVDEAGIVREIVAAPKLDAQPITRAFLASLMRNACTSNPDYLKVQSRMIERRMEAMPVSRSKSGIKAVKRQTMNSQAAEIKRLKKVIADMEMAHGVHQEERRAA